MKFTLRTISLAFLFIAAVIHPGNNKVYAQEFYTYTSEVVIDDEHNQAPPTRAIFDDRMLLNGYTKKYSNLPKEILLAMIKDDTLTQYRSAAAIKVFKEKFSNEIVSREKKITEKILLRRLHRADSPFVQVEIMHTLCQMDRYRYFKSMVPALIQKLDHYNATVNKIAFESLNQIIQTGNNHHREARVVFNTLRKVLFLLRKHLETVEEPDSKLTKKLKLLRWSIKILGNQELKKLPMEVISLL